MSQGARLRHHCQMTGTNARLFRGTSRGHRHRVSDMPTVLSDDNLRGQGESHWAKVLSP